jgi:hypothetical protein
MQHLLWPPPVMLQLVFKVFMRGGQHHLLVSDGAEGGSGGMAPSTKTFS